RPRADGRVPRGPAFDRVAAPGDRRGGWARIGRDRTRRPPRPPAGRSVLTRFSLVVVLLVAVGLVGAPAPAVGAGATVDVVVDGGQRFQPIDGFGVNANPKLWNGGELRAAIDELVGLGSTLWRVDIDGNSTWEAHN